VSEEAVLFRLVVVGGDCKNSVDAELARFLGHLHRMAGVVGAGAGNDLCLLLGYRIDHRLEQGELLKISEGWRFSGGAGNDESVGPGGHQVSCEVPRFAMIHFAVCGERRDHGRGNMPEGGGWCRSHSASLPIRRRRPEFD
jgi:hypothetical protein